MTDRKKRVQSAFRLNLEQQKNRAKDLLSAACAGDPSALARLAAVAAVRGDGPRPPGTQTTRLADAQFVIARELGFSSWAALKRHAQAMDDERRAMLERRAALDGELGTLHLRCGSDIRSTLADAGFAGDFLEHAYPYCQGPVTEGPNRLELRAEFLAAAFGRRMERTYEDMLAGCREDESKLAAARDYERVVLWMEHDSYDQLVLIRCLALFAEAGPPRVLELVTTNRFPGSTRFIGLGQLPPEALRLLWSKRRPVNAAELELGARAFKALAAEDPRALAAIARSGTPALPYLGPALLRHLRELPSCRNGLGLTEELILEMLDETPHRVGDAFQLLNAEREPLPWLGDLGFMQILDCMGQASGKVFLRTPDDTSGHAARDRLSITDLGRAVLRGDQDWLALMPPSRWVGGVRVVPGESCWRWNESARMAERRA